MICCPSLCTPPYPRDAKYFLLPHSGGTSSCYFALEVPFANPASQGPTSAGNVLQPSVPSSAASNPMTCSPAYSDRDRRSFLYSSAHTLHPAQVPLLQSVHCSMLWMNEEGNRIFSQFPINKAHLCWYVVNADIKKPTYFGEMNITLP